jgi:Uma2 family endonuclease
MASPARTGLTLADVYALPDDGHRYELLDGELFVSPLARRRHQWVVTEISYQLKAWVADHGGAVYAGVNVDLADDTHLEPDVAYARSEDTTGLAFREPPELIVEVSSPSTRSFDLGAKKDRYAAAGIVEFWFVDLDDDLLLRFVCPLDRHTGNPQRLQRGDVLVTDLMPGLALPVDGLLGSPQR